LVPGSRWIENTTVPLSLRRRSMSDHHAPPPQGPSSPRCDKCGQPMSLITAIQLVTEPGQVRLFECTKCEKLGFITEQ
jgi:hypothetical protein